MVQRRESFKGTFSLLKFSIFFTVFSLFLGLFIASEMCRTRRGIGDEEERRKMSRKFVHSRRKAEKMCKKEESSLTKENARVFFFLFSLFILLGRKLNENSSLGKSSLHIHTRRGAHRAAASRGGRRGIFWGRALLSMRDEAEDWRPIRKERRKKVFEKNGCSCPFYRPEIFTFETFAIFGRPRRARRRTRRHHSPMNLSSTFSDT